MVARDPNDAPRIAVKQIPITSPIWKVITGSQIIHKISLYDIVKQL